MIWENRIVLPRANLKILNEPTLSIQCSPKANEVATLQSDEEVPLRKAQRLDVDATLARSLPRVFASDELRNKTSLSLKRKSKQSQR